MVVGKVSGLDYGGWRVREEEKEKESWTEF